MAAVNSAVIFSLVEELADDSMLLEASSCVGDKEFVVSPHYQRGKRKPYPYDNYFEQIVRLYSLSDFRSPCQMFRTTVTFLEGLLAACPDLPYEQNNGGRPTIDLWKQVLTTL